MRLIKDDNSNVIQMHDASQTQTVALSTVSAQSTAFAGETLVEIYCDVDCFVAFGANPTATTSSMIVVGGIPRYKMIPSGYKIAGIVDSGTANLRITY